jgi:hypothetical protein
MRSAVRYLTYSENGGMTQREGMELGYISAEYVPDALAWLNNSKALGINPEDLFRRVDFGEFSTK